MNAQEERGLVEVAVQPLVAEIALRILAAKLARKLCQIQTAFVEVLPVADVTRREALLGVREGGEAHIVQLEGHIDGEGQARAVLLDVAADEEDGGGLAEAELCFLLCRGENAAVHALLGDVLGGDLGCEWRMKEIRPSRGGRRGMRSFPSGRM